MEVVMKDYAQTATDSCIEWVDVVLDIPAPDMREFIQECIFELRQFPQHNRTIVRCIQELSDLTAIIRENDGCTTFARECALDFYNKLQEGLIEDPRDPPS
jgi:hypothetical protein